jgi:hypothetical protein
MQGLEGRSPSIHEVEHMLEPEWEEIETICKPTAGGQLSSGHYVPSTKL